MNLLKRYWAAGLILVVVVAHASIIGYVRSRVSRLNKAKSSAIEIGTFRFQNIKVSQDKVFQFRLYAIADPVRRYQAEESIKQLRIEIVETSEQLLRQVDPSWLADPAQVQLRERLMDVVGKHLTEPVIQRVLITDWLEIPTTLLTPTLAAGNDPATLDLETPGAARIPTSSHDEESHDEGSHDDHGGEETHEAKAAHGSEDSHAKPAAKGH